MVVLALLPAVITVVMIAALTGREALSCFRVVFQGYKRLWIP